MSHITEQSALFALRRAGVRKPLIEEQVIAAGLPEPVAEFMFAKAIGRKWRFDYAWPDHKIALEIEGAVFGRLITTADGKKIRAGGRHSTGAGLQADAFKYNRAAILGWLVIRATTTMVRDGHAITELTDAFRAQGVLR
jgi:hypothetical protein